MNRHRDGSYRNPILLPDDNQKILKILVHGSEGESASKMLTKAFSHSGFFIYQKQDSAIPTSWANDVVASDSFKLNPQSQQPVGLRKKIPIVKDSIPVEALAPTTEKTPEKRPKKRTTDDNVNVPTIEIERKSNHECVGVSPMSFFGYTGVQPIPVEMQDQTARWQYLKEQCENFVKFVNDYKDHLMSDWERQEREQHENNDAATS